MSRFFRFAYRVVKFAVQVLFPSRTAGLENIPEGGALICGNHSSLWDPLVIGASMPIDTGLVFMAKDQLFHYPVLGPVIRALGAFPVKRGESDLTAIKTAMRHLQEGKKLIIFPEGRRVTGEGDAEAKGGVALLATRTGAPVVPVFCGERRKLFHRNTVAFGEPYRPQIAGRRPTAEENREIAGEILRRVYAQRDVNAWK